MEIARTKHRKKRAVPKSQPVDATAFRNAAIKSGIAMVGRLATAESAELHAYVVAHEDENLAEVRQKFTEKFGLTSITETCLACAMIDGIVRAGRQY